MHMPWIDWFRFNKNRARPGGVDSLAVVLYTRQGCHLCDTAWELLEAARVRHGFSLESVDVDSDPALTAEYGMDVPVVVINGKVRFRGIISAVLLQRVFDAEA
jgi:glutaredoxin